MTLSSAIYLISRNKNAFSQNFVARRLSHILPLITIGQKLFNELVRLKKTYFFVLDSGQWSITMAQFQLQSQLL